MSRARTAPGRPACSGQGGQALLWAAVMLPLFLSVIGLALDGGLVFNARRELQNVADVAARAGANQIDERAYRESDGTTVVLDPESARQVAEGYVAGERAGLEARITVEPQRVVVTVRRPVPLSFLRLLGIQTASVSAFASAEVRHGITQSER